METLDMIDLSNPKSVQKYEDVLRKRLKKLGYHLSKRKTIQPGPPHIELKRGSRKRGFRITEIASGAIVDGDNYELDMADVDRFWLNEYKQWYVKRREDKERERREKLAVEKRPKTIQIMDRWTITNDDRAVRALNEHISRYGDFDADGHGAGGDIATAMYRAYRPYACPQFSRVWPADGDKFNLTDSNLVSDADEISFDDANITPITTQRRIWHNEHRIFVKLAIHDEIFFTVYTPELFQLLCNSKVLNGWYRQEQVRDTKTVYRLYCRVFGKIVSFAEIVALYDAGKIALDNIIGSVLAGKQWLRDNKLQVDHLRNNVANNCPHSIAIMPETKNGSKNDLVARIHAPFAFVAVRIDENFRVILGKFGTQGEYDRRIVCHGAQEFIDCLRAFYKLAQASGDMRPDPENYNKTACISQMLQDDGLEYHDGHYNPIEGLLRADENDFMRWNGDISLLKP